MSGAGRWTENDRLSNKIHSEITLQKREVREISNGRGFGRGSSSVGKISLRRVQLRARLRSRSGRGKDEKAAASKTLLSRVRFVRRVI